MTTTSVTVKLYASLAEYLPAGAVDNAAPVAVPAGTSVGGVLRRMGVPSEHCHLVLINGVFVPPGERDTRALAAGDTLAAWPPVAGGRARA